MARPLFSMSQFARLLNRLQADGWHIGIVSWLSKSGSDNFNTIVTRTKQEWLNQHLPSAHWDEVVIVPYGTPKHTVVDLPSGILFDDEAPHRHNWSGIAYDVENIVSILKSL